MSMDMDDEVDDAIDTSDQDFTQDVVTDSTTESYSSRIGNACSGIVFGIVLLAGSVALLWWNEGRSVRRHKTLQEGAKLAVSISADTVDSSNSGKLVHVTDMALAGSSVSDDTFGIYVSGALQLFRTVEMYQWTEKKEEKTRKNSGGSTHTTTTYRYSKKWSDSVVDSEYFYQANGHENPGYMPFQSTSMAADPITVGAFYLPDDMVSMINWFTPLDTSEISLDNLPENTLCDRVQTYGSGFYFGDNPYNPQVGDLKVTFEIASEGYVSILGEQVGQTFDPYFTNNGGNIFILEQGVYSSKAMFERAEAQNQQTTWLLRGLGFFLMLSGFQLLFQPLETIADVIPLIGDLVSGASFAVAFLLSGFLSSLVIASAWLFYRPILSICLVAVAAGLAYVIRKKLCDEKQKSDPLIPKNDATVLS